MNLRQITLSASLVLLAVTLGGCTPPRGMPYASVIGFDGKNAIAPDCKALSQPSMLLDGGIPRPSMQWGCATYTNLAAQLANPEDLVAPKTLGPANAAVAAAAVHRYEAGQVIKLDEGTTRDAK